MPQQIFRVTSTGAARRFTCGNLPAFVEVLLWGAGGGGGGPDFGDDPGGNGAGAGFSTRGYSMSEGDTLDVLIGRFGDGGWNSDRALNVGVGGSSFSQKLFSTADVPSIDPTVQRVANGAWNPWMNARAIWDIPYVPFGTFSRSYTFTMPHSDNVFVQWAVDDIVTISIDGSVLASSGNTMVWGAATSRFLSAGTHTISWTAADPIGVAAGLALDIYISYSGGNGGSGVPNRLGDAYGGGSGGGGGGASLVFFNGSVQQRAGGGGGGGGAGARFQAWSDAPNAASGQFSGRAGQDGQNATWSLLARFDGGGGGGGGGGSSGGAGGVWGGNSFNATGGGSGSSSGGSTGSASGRTPARANLQSEYGIGRVGYGGRGALRDGYNHFTGEPGTSGGAVVIVTYPDNVSVRNGGAWRGVFNTWIKNTGIWRPVEALYIKNNGIWEKPIAIGTMDTSWVSFPVGQYGRLPPISNLF